MQLVRQAPIEGEFLQYAWTARTIADAEDGAVEIKDNLSRGFKLIIVALVGKLFGSVMKRLESESWGAVLTPRCAEMLAL